MSPDDKAREAIRLTLEWDERRGYLMPYAVRDKLRHAYESAKQKGEAEGWRDIESAPENEWVLVWSGHHVEMACRRDWRWLVANSYGVTISPTAWRPLPEPPMLSAGGEG